MQECELNSLFRQSHVCFMPCIGYRLWIVSYNEAYDDVTTWKYFQLHLTHIRRNQWWQNIDDVFAVN